MYSPEVKTYAGYDSPDRQSLTVTVTGDHVIKYYYDLHYYDINVDTQGGEWYEEQDDFIPGIFRCRGFFHVIS